MDSPFLERCFQTIPVVARSQVSRLGPIGPSICPATFPITAGAMKKGIKVLTAILGGVC